MIRSLLENVELPSAQSVFEFYLDPSKGMAVRPWSELVAGFSLSSLTTNLCEVMVPTVETARQTYLLQLLLARGQGALFTGGSGKSLVIRHALGEAKDTDAVLLSLSGASTAMSTQLGIEEGLQKKGRNSFGAQQGRRVAIFVDDVHLPSSSGPTEFLRQLLERKGAYSRESLRWTKISDCTLICASNSGIGPRLARRLNRIVVPRAGKPQAEFIFGTLLGEVLRLRGYPDPVRALARDVAAATFDVYKKVRPEPSRRFCMFSLKDVARVMKGVALAGKRDLEGFARLWTHEVCRVFQDRMGAEEGTALVAQVAFGQITKCAKLASWDYRDLFELHKIHFAASPRAEYEELHDLREAKTKFESELARESAEHALLPSIFFSDTVIEIVLKITRVLSQTRGYALLVGPPGTGKRTLARFSVFVSRCLLREPMIAEFQTTLKECVRASGILGKKTCLLLGEKQILTDEIMGPMHSLMSGAGSVPCLFSREEWDKIQADMRPVMSEIGCDSSRGTIHATFLQRVHQNLAAIFCTVPAQEFEESLRRFPSLSEESTIIYVSPWDHPALAGVCEKCLDQDMSSSKEIAAAAAEIHLSQGGSHGEYLDMMHAFSTIEKRRRSECSSALGKLAAGLGRLREARSRITEANGRVESLQSQLKGRAEAADQGQRKVLEHQRAVAEAEKALSAQKHELGEKGKHLQTLLDDAEAEAKLVRPETAAAMAEVKQIDKKAWQDIKTTSAPPAASVTIFEAVMVLLQEKTDWENVRSVLEDTASFLGRLVSLSERHTPVPDSAVKKLRTSYMSIPEFDPEQLKGKSTAFRPLVRWVRSMASLQETLLRAEPKRGRYEAERKKADQDAAKVTERAKSVAEAKSRLAAVRGELEGVQEEKARIAEEISGTKRRVARGQDLVKMLEREETVWETAEHNVKEQSENLLGNALIAAAFATHAGLLDEEERRTAGANWTMIVSSKKLPVSLPFDFISAMGYRDTLEEWWNNGLAKDRYSGENAAISMNCWKWPLVLDPHARFGRWIRQQIKGLVVTRFIGRDFMQLMVNAVRLGKSLLIEDVDGTETGFEAVLGRVVVTRSKGEDMAKTILLDGNEVEYNANFRLFMTSPRSRVTAASRLIPAFSGRATIIDFTIGAEGLEELLLHELADESIHDTESQRESTEKLIAGDTELLNEAEEKVLKTLGGNTLDQILDDETVIESLKAAKKTISDSGRKIEEETKLLATIIEARDRFRSISADACTMYLVAEKEMHNISDTYRFSLEAFRHVFSSSVGDNSKIIQRVYAFFARGMAEPHRAIFALLFLVRKGMQKGELSSAAWEQFLNGSGSDSPSRGPNPLSGLMTDHGWRFVQTLECEERLRGLAADMAKCKPEWELALKRSEIPEKWAAKLSVAAKFVILIRILPANADLARSIEQHMTQELGAEFLLAPGGVEAAFSDSTKTTPILVTFPPGVDVSATISHLAEQKKFSGRLTTLGMGPDQGPAAKRAIQSAQARGEWLVLENVHLSAGWLGELEAVVESMNESRTASVHDDFRLFLTCPGMGKIPATVLHFSVKVAVDPIQRSIKETMQELYRDTVPDLFDSCARRTEDYYKILFGLCFFHAKVKSCCQATSADLESAAAILRWIIEEQDEVPWGTLYFCVGQTVYASRTQSERERRHILSVLKETCRSELLRADYAVAGVRLPSGEHNTLEEYQVGVVDRMQDQILPTKEKESFLEILRRIPTKDEDRVTRCRISEIQSKLPQPIDLATTSKASTYTSSVLAQEAKTYNSILVEISRSLEEATIGSEVWISVAKDKIPPAWPSLCSGSLTGYAQTLASRVEYFRAWANKGRPESFWLPAFLFPGRLICSVLRQQQHPKTPIENLRLSLTPARGAEDAITFCGLSILGAVWDTKRGVLVKSGTDTKTELPPMRAEARDTEQQIAEGMVACRLYCDEQKEDDMAIVELPTEGETRDLAVFISCETNL